MGHLHTLLLAVGAIFTLVIVGRMYALLQNYRIARKIGLPIVIALESWQDPFWVLFCIMFKPLLFKLGIWDRTATDLSTFGFPVKDHYGLHAKHGPAFSLVTPFKTNIIVSDVDAARTVFKEWRIFVKNKELYDMMTAFGPNLNTVNGDDWQRHRKVAATGFKESNSKLVWKAALKQARGLGQRMATESSKGNTHGVTLGMLRESTEVVALHVLNSAAMGKEYDFEQGVEQVEPGHEMSFAKAMKIIIQNVSPMLVPITFAAAKMPSFLVPAGLQRLQIAIKEFRWGLEDSVRREREDYHSGKAEKDNLLSVLVRANESEKYQDGSSKWALSDLELYGNLYMFTQAGHETTSGAIAFAIPMLVVHPEVQRWIQEEVDGVSVQADPHVYDEVYPKLVRLEALMYEVLRFFAAVPLHPKYTANYAQPLTIAGKEYTIPPNHFVSINYYAVHFDPHTWGPDVDEFKPSRFVTSSPQGAGHEEFAGPPKGAEYVGWASGPRVCPGKKFSQVEFVGVMAHIVKNYELRPAPLKGESDEQARRRLLRTCFDNDHFISLQLYEPESAGFFCVPRKK